MAETTAIEWAVNPNASGRHLSVQKSAAKRIGCSHSEWVRLKNGGFDWCYRCAKWLKRTQFTKDASRGSGLSSTCRPCNSIRSTRSRYGLTEVEYAEITAPNNCPICGKSHGMMVIDHCHNSGKVRAQICQSCNSGLGAFSDSPEILRKAAAYLEKHNG